MRVCAAVALAAGVAVLSTGPALAHHSFASEFDNSIAVTVTGLVRNVEMINPHSFIYLDVETEGGVEQWALEGPGPFQIQRRGFADLAFIKPGARIEVCGYLAKSDVATTKRDPASGKAARKLQAAVLTSADRGRLVWSNYRQGKCGLDN